MSTDYSVKRRRIAKLSETISTIEIASDVDEHQDTSHEAQTRDERLMRRALELAAEGMGSVSPSPLVGCVIANGAGEIIGEGCYLYEEITHAEVLALNEAGARARGATAYVSLEPHAHHGRTPPCTEALIRAGISRVVAPIEDPNPLVSGKGFEVLRHHGIEVTTGLFAVEAARQNEKYICAMRRARPFVHLKLAASLNGRIDFRGHQTPSNEHEIRWITNAQSRVRVHELRHEYDAILVGANTARVDNPLLTDCSLKPRRRPLVRVTLDETLSLPLDSQLVSTASDVNPLLVFASEGRANLMRKNELERRGVKVELLAGGTRNLAQVLENLFRQSLHSVLVEGGARIAGAFMDANLVDKISFFIAPLIIGGADTTQAIVGTNNLRLRDVQHISHGDDIEITGYPQDSKDDPRHDNVSA